MTKLYIREIESCMGCPSKGADINVTRWLCVASKTRGKFICWMTEEEEEKVMKEGPPEWCPLPDK